jgi:predicted house-cleaning NTP pyrophosphatase (Maf/HAM1 superfamily)
VNTNNTPEADKAERMAYSGEYMVPTEVARKLERERDEARDAFVIATDQMVIAQGKAREVWRERNEARNQRDILRRDAQKEAEHHDRMVGELEKVYKERDEARDAFVIATDQMVIAQGKAREVWRERNEWAAMCGRYKQERDEQLKDLEK